VQSGAGLSPPRWPTLVLRFIVLVLVLVLSAAVLVLVLDFLQPAVEAGFCTQP
jgi:hypothetical protein